MDGVWQFSPGISPSTPAIFVCKLLLLQLFSSVGNQYQMFPLTNNDYIFVIYLFIVIVTKFDAWIIW